MKKAQAIKLWKDLESSTSEKEIIASFENKKGYGGRRTLERFSQAAAGFKENTSLNDIAFKTGWSHKYLDKIYAWWKESFREEPRLSANSKILQNGHSTNLEVKSGVEPPVILHNIRESDLTDQVNPFLIKAQGEHFAAIETLVKDWFEKFNQAEFVLLNEVFEGKLKIGPRFGDELILPYDLNPIYCDPLYGSLKEHLQGNSLWNLYPRWEQCFSDHYQKSQNLIKEIRRIGNTWSDVELTSNFEQPFIDFINMHDCFEESINARYKEGNYLYAQSGDAPEYWVLTDKLKNHDNEYKKLANDLLESPLYLEYLKAEKEVGKYWVEIHTILQELIIRKDFIRTKCRLCPW